MKPVIKTTKDRIISISNGLTREQAFKLEHTCLKLLNKKFECICKKKSTHFPKIISLYPSMYEFTLSYCGRSIFDREKENIIIKIKNLEEQIDCIIHNLKKANVMHIDMVPNGKNLCLSRKGIISVIDFDIAVVNEKILSDKINEIYVDKYGGTRELYYEQFKQNIINICKNASCSKIK